MLSPQKTKTAFSLVELLVALTITLLISTAILPLIPRFFSLIASSKNQVTASTLISELDLQLDRDFSSLLPNLGFDGSPSHCAFWTIRQTAPDSFNLRHVAYEYKNHVLSITVLSPSDYFSLASTNAFPLIPHPIASADLFSLPRQSVSVSRFTLNSPTPFSFAFGSTNLEESVSSSPWTNPTNAPARLQIPLSPHPATTISRLYHRRSRP